MRFRLRHLPFAIAAMYGAISLPLHAQILPGALPTGWNVTSGNAAFSQSGNTLNINQTTNQALVNFQTFNVGSAASVVIRQPSAMSALLARTTGGDPSQINGQITANGALWLINPAGIMVGAGARIDVGSFVASTLNVSDSDFLAGRLTFTSGPTAGELRNAGTIQSASGGSIYLVAPVVSNTGTLNAPHGEVLLAAGQNVQLMDTGTPGVSVALSGAAGEASNLGRIVAEAGRIGLAAGLVHNSGEINADSAVSEGGRVFLRASGDLQTTAASTLSAAGTTGGRIELIADGAASIDGIVKATGSAGRGGYVDTSGHRSLDVVKVPMVGPGGEWHIDPFDIVIGAGLDAGVVGTDAIVSTAAGAQISAATITAQLDAGTSVSITTGAGTAPPMLGDITVSAPILMTGFNDSALTLNASNNIIINASIGSSNGALTLNLNSNYQGAYPAGGHDVQLSAGLDLHGGALNVSEGVGGSGNGTLDIVGGTTSLGMPTSSINAAVVNVQSGGTLALNRTGSAISGSVNNGGTVTVGAAGTALLDHGGSHGGTFDVAAGSDLSMSGGQTFGTGAAFSGTGTIEWAGNITLGSKLLFGAGGNALVLHDTGLIGSGQGGLWTQGAGVVVDGQVTLFGSAAWTNGASVAVVGNGGISALNEGTRMVNDGSITTSGTQGFVLQGDGAAISNFVNNGSLIKSGGGDQSYTGIASATGSTVSAEAGILTLASSQIDGQVQVASGAKVMLNNATLNSGVSFRGAGSVGWQGWLTLAGSVDIDAAAPAFTLLGDAILNGQGNVLTTRNLVHADGAQIVIFDQSTWNNLGTFSVGPDSFAALMLQGSGSFNNQAGGTVLVDQGRLSATFDEAHMNNGAIVLQNGGTLDTGGTDLYNNGRISGSGTLALGGAGGGTLFNNGTVAPGTSAAVGTLDVQGNYIQESSGALEVKLDGGMGAGAFDLLNVDGSARLGGSLQISTLGSFAPTNGAMADFVVAGGGSSGSFDQVVAPAATWPGGTATMTVSYPGGNAPARVTVAVLPSLNACIATPSLQGCSAVLPTAAACIVSPTLPGCSVVVVPTPPLPPAPRPPVPSPSVAPTPTPPPSADICTIAPNSALCQVLSPPTASEPVKPVQQASNEVIRTVTSAQSTPVGPQTPVFTDVSSDAPKTTGTDKPADKADTKEVASADKSGAKNDPVKKMFCN
jgi:filamentous hemagglutinin family protein